MKIGITGHQKRRGLNWDWVAAQVQDQLRQLSEVRQAYSSLAAGADQIFASAALDIGIPIIAVIPLNGYERFFRGQELSRYRDLLGRCEGEGIGLLEIGLGCSLEVEDRTRSTPWRREYQQRNGLGKSCAT